MNISYRWLQSLVPDLGATPDTIAERLTSLGYPVESMHSLADGLEGIVVARVLDVRPHPNADRLRVCEVDGGAGVVQVVCGAPNVVAGGWYPLAPVGASLPGGMVIRKAKLRGEVSEGMLCSEVELGLGRGKDGLMELHLDREASEVQPGASLVDVLGLDDVRLDVEVTSNRPDLLSHRGIARELAPKGEASLVTPGFPDAVEGSEAAEGSGVSPVELAVEDEDRCPRYLGLVLRGVRVGPSPAWLQARLRSVGARPINNVVDATNYILLETGQPLHAFDLATLSGGKVVVRRAREGETLRTLDGIERALSTDMLAICDAQRPVALAGVMGGEATEVTSETRDVFLECAIFAPGPIRATRKAVGLSTDASYRFERGVDPQGLDEALRRCAHLIRTVAGGTPEGLVVQGGAEPAPPRRIHLRIPRVERLLGISLEAGEIRSLLEPLGFALAASTGAGEGAAGGFEVTVPGWRHWDVAREVDLIEEVARRHGYDRVPDTLGPYRPGSVPDHPLFALEDALRTLLVGRGLLEAQTPAFAPADEGEVEVLNPVSAEEGRLRGSLLPALRRRVEYNLARGNRDVRLFELGTVFHPRAQGLPRETTRLAVVLHGDRAPAHWSGDSGALDIWELRGLAEQVSATLPGWGVVPWGEVAPPEAEAETDPVVQVAEQLRAEMTLAVVDPEGRVTGVAGCVLPQLLDLPPWAGSVWALELSLPGHPAPLEPPRFRPLPTHPGMERDLALLVPDAVAASRVVRTAQAHGGELMREVQVFDVYAGKGVEEGHRSLAIRLRFRAEGRSLTDGDVDPAVKAVTRALEEEAGVRIRGG